MKRNEASVQTIGRARLAQGIWPCIPIGARQENEPCNQNDSGQACEGAPCCAFPSYRPVLNARWPQGARGVAPAGARQIHVMA
eukprot:8115277-Pyramimonas_sp.AAC.1